MPCTPPLSPTERDTSAHSSSSSPEPLQAEVEEPHLDHSISTLDNLYEFYHHGRTWISYQRAALVQEDVVPSAESDRATQEASSSREQRASSPPLAENKLPKLEPISTNALIASARIDVKSFRRPPRKRNYGLKIDTVHLQTYRRGNMEPRLILPPMRSRPPSPGPATNSSVTETATQSMNSVPILDLFESMMKSRLESCQRIDILIRRANRRTVVEGGGVARARS